MGTTLQPDGGQKPQGAEPIPSPTPLHGRCTTWSWAAKGHPVWGERGAVAGQGLCSRLYENSWLHQSKFLLRKVEKTGRTAQATEERKAPKAGPWAKPNTDASSAGQGLRGFGSAEADHSEGSLRWPTEPGMPLSHSPCEAQPRAHAHGLLLHSKPPPGCCPVTSSQSPQKLRGQKTNSKAQGGQDSRPPEGSDRSWSAPPAREQEGAPDPSLVFSSLLRLRGGTFRPLR